MDPFIYTYIHTHLGCSGHEPRFPRREALLGAGEDAGDSVCLRQQRSIDHGEAESRQNTRQTAGQPGWFGENREGGGVAERHSGEDEVAQLPCGGLDDRGVIVANKDSSC